MNKRLIIPIFLFTLFLFAFNTFEPPPVNRLIIQADLGKDTISRHIYGHFSEHLGRGIYDGLWVGENSSIPNTNGVRTDIIEALKKIQIPNLRWPGGCFADEYHWMNGIGTKQDRAKMVNTHWGGIVEDNSFGTHEFLNLCEVLGTEPYISANLGSGTVQEMSEWVEYVNSTAETPMTLLRKKNGRDKPWNVKFWGVGNENWGCGGNMTAEYYADLYRHYATYCRNYGENRLIKIACGASDFNTNWTDVLMNKVGQQMQGLSLHYYTVKGWQGNKGSATEFDQNEYFQTMKKGLAMDDLLKRHITIMDKVDPGKNIALMVDEWGTWFDVEPGTNPGFLYQQNTLRDAFVAASTLNIFNKNCDRVKMANIAQLVNVLQSLILTQKEKMILTPTYHVFDLYKVHHDAVFLPFDLTTENYELNGEQLPALNISSSKAKDGSINISIVNIHPDKAMPLECDLRGVKVSTVSGKILTGNALNAHNTFDQPSNVKVTDFNKATLKNNILIVELPAKSVVVLNVK